MTRKFTFLLMALLALTGFKSWGQNYEYTLVTSLPSTPDPDKEYVLGYQDGNNYYFHSSGESANQMVLSTPSENTKVYKFVKNQTLYSAKCGDKYLKIYNTYVSLDSGNDNFIKIYNGVVNDYNEMFQVYNDGNVLKAYCDWYMSLPTGAHLISFFERTGGAPTYTVTVTSDTEGCTASADKASYEEGETVTLSYEADAFHYFTGYESSDVTITGSTFAMPANNVSVTAHFGEKPTHSITATVNPENAGTASVTYQSNTITEAPAGAVLNLSAIANPGFDFVSWTIGDEVVSTSANYNYTMPDNDVVIVANFGEHQLLHVNIDPNIVGGTITVNPSECDPGTTVTVTPNAASGYQYVYGNITVTDANGQSVYVNQGYPSSTFEMPSTDVTVSATFIKSYSISIGSHQHCTVSTSPMGSAIANADVTVLITPEAGYRVTNVTATYEGGQITAVYDYEYNGVQYYSFTMPAYDVTVNVVCALTYTVNYTQPAGGTISVSPTTYVPAGQEVSIDITQIYNHYSFDYANYASKISVKDASENPIPVNQEDNTHYNFTMPASNVTVSVTFDQDASYDIDVTQPEGCTIEVSPSENVYADEPVYLYYSNVELGYQFVGWVVKDGESTIELYNYYGTYYFIMPPSENVTVTANVQALTDHTVNIASGITGGSVSAFTDNDHEAPITAYAGEYVYLTKTPEPGYQFISFTVTSGCGTVEVYNNFYFFMPDCDVTVSADFEIAPQNLTVNDGTEKSREMPFSFYYSGNSYGQTKSQYIIPYTDLENMIDGTVTDLNFYTYSPTNHTFNGIWKVYLQEVSYTTFGYTYSFEDVSEMQLVYSGDMSIANNILHIHLDTPYIYEDGNLMVCFEQTSEASNPGDYWNDYWYGVSTSSNSACSYSSYFNYPWFAPKTTFEYLPNANPAPRYNISINNPTGVTITASKTKAKEGATITLSATFDEGYVFNNWVVMQGGTPVTVENDQFEMPAGAVTVTADVTAPHFYNVYLDPSTAYTIDADPVEHILAGKTITLSSDAAESGKTVDAWIVTEHTSGTPVEVTFNDDYNLYQFTMPNDDVDVTATFRNLKDCTINFYVNGVKWEEGTENVLEDEWVYLYEIRPETIPAGTTFTGWATSEIETYQTTAPEDLKYSFRVKDNMDLYAVFGFTEKIPTGESTWSQLNEISKLEDGDEVIFTGYQYDESTYPNCYHVLTQRSSATTTDFGKTDGMSWNDLNHGNFPEEPVVFTAVNNAGSWNFMYEDAFVEGTSALAINSDGSMGPKSYLGGYDNWSIYCYDYPWTSGVIYNEDTYNYINFDGSRFYGGEYNNAASLYRRVIQTDDHNYYMTSVLGFGGTDEHIASNTSATNVVIANNAKLTIDDDATLNVEGICLSASHDATKFVVAEGGQLVHHNEGTVATFEKSITGYTSTNDHYYLIANPTDEEEVANLVNEDGYDLYTFNPAQAFEWNNEHENTALTSGIGYLYANSETVTLEFAGELTPAGSTAPDLIYAEEGDGIDFPGFNLLGNPFACNAYVSGYNFYTMVGGEFILNEGSATIAPCEGFFVEATGTEQSVTISTAAPATAPNALSLTVSQNRGNVIDRAIVNFNGNNDLHKFMMNPAHTNISLAKSGEEFAALSTEAEGEIPVSFKAEKNGSYTITVNTENVEAQYLHLIDNMTGADVDLLSSPSYTFNASTSDYAYRFKLVFNVTMDDANNGNDGMGSSFAYISNGELIISNEGRATLQVIDVMGRIVRNEQIEGDARISTEGMVAGVYVLNLNGNVQKIVVR